MSAASRDYGQVFKDTFSTAVERNNIVVLLVGSIAVAFLSPLSLGILMGPLQLGLAYACNKMARGETVEVNDLWSGFSRFIPALIAMILMGIGIFVGSLLLVLPGLVLAFFLTFTFHVLANSPDMSGVDAMKASFGLVKEHPADVAVFWVAMIVLGMIAGATMVGSLLMPGLGSLLLAVLYRPYAQGALSAAQRVA